MSNTNLVYGLKDPRNDVYRYIGKSTVGKNRPLQHLIESHSKSINDWVNELKEKNLYPIVEVIESDIELDKLMQRERYWIYHFSQNYDLLNGGDVGNVIKSPSKLIDSEINIMYDCLNNLSEVYKKLKSSCNLTDITLSNLLNLSRATLWKFKKNSDTISVKSVIKIIFLIKHPLIDFFNFYYDNSHEFKGKHPDTYEEFIFEINTNKKFAKMWFDKYYRYENGKLLK